MSKVDEKRRFGFTLIEIIVALSVVAVLIVLAIPAVQAAREASRSMYCSNNLRQLGLALNGYEAVYKTLPRGSNGGFYSTHVMILPYIDKSTYFNQFNFIAGGPLGGTSDGQVNATIANCSISEFLCPADPYSLQGPRTNYAVNGGFGDQTNEQVGSFITVSLGGNNNVPLSKITDGTANTLAMSEWRTGAELLYDETTVVYRLKVSPLGRYQDFVDNCMDASRARTEFGAWLKEARWNLGLYGSTIMNFNSLPNTKNCFHDFSFDLGNWPPGSYHANGVNVLMHDGHIRRIGRIGVKEWKAMSSMSGGDL